jgi:hypothetical protein
MQSLRGWSAGGSFRRESERQEAKSDPRNETQSSTCGAKDLPLSLSTCSRPAHQLRAVWYGIRRHEVIRRSYSTAASRSRVLAVCRAAASEPPHVMLCTRPKSSLACISAHSRNARKGSAAKKRLPRKTHLNSKLDWRMRAPRARDVVRRDARRPKIRDFLRRSLHESALRNGSIAQVAAQQAGSAGGSPLSSSRA